MNYMDDVVLLLTACINPNALYYYLGYRIA